MRADQAPNPPTSHSSALVTTATSQPALGTGFAALGLVALLDLPRVDRADRMMALGGAAAAGWYLANFAISARLRPPTGRARAETTVMAACWG